MSESNKNNNNNNNQEENKKGYEIPSHLGYNPANPKEFTDHGKYNLYHLQIAVGNHFVVNGGCMVEAWFPESKYF